MEVIGRGLVRMFVKCGCTNARACGWKGAECTDTSALSEVTSFPLWIKNRLRELPDLSEGTP